MPCMANPAPLTAQLTPFVAGAPQANGKGKPSKIQQLTAIQAVLMAKIQAEKTKAADASSCARAFVLVEEAIRIARGKFKPGDVRASDLDPVRLAWQVKRFTAANKRTLGRLGGLIELTAPPDDPVPAPPTISPAEPSE
jgi:hypothetical protein